MQTCNEGITKGKPKKVQSPCNRQWEILVSMHSCPDSIQAGPAHCGWGASYLPRTPQQSAAMLGDSTRKAGCQRCSAGCTAYSPTGSSSTAGARAPQRFKGNIGTVPNGRGWSGGFKGVHRQPQPKSVRHGDLFVRGDPTCRCCVTRWPGVAHATLATYTPRLLLHCPAAMTTTPQCNALR